jgi:competence CoiA-like predicted nuclease
MAAKAGETEHQTGDFYCASCDEKVHVRNQGTQDPQVP